MRSYSYLLLFLSSCFFSQNIIYNKIEKTHANNDLFFLKIDSTSPNAIYLGEIEVQGFSTEDVAVFNKIYTKAKKIGANAFQNIAINTLDNKENFDPSHYKLALFYLPKDQLPKECNTIYMINKGEKNKKFKISNTIIHLDARSFMKKNMESGEKLKLSTIGILGTSIYLSYKEGQSSAYYSMSGAKLFSSNKETNPGLVLKTGDIEQIEESFGSFLTLIYKIQKN